MGPHMFSHVIGGPACSSMRSCIPGNSSAATPIPTSTAGIANKIECFLVCGLDMWMIDEPRERKPMSRSPAAARPFHLATLR